MEFEILKPKLRVLRVYWLLDESPLSDFLQNNFILKINQSSSDPESFIEKNTRKLIFRDFFPKPDKNFSRSCFLMSDLFFIFDDLF